MAAPKCFITRDEFLTAVGTVNADITLRGKTTVRYATRYTPIADRIAMMARHSGTKVARTLTDDGLHVIVIKGFGGHTWVA
jgi:hypothetical protein